MSHLSALPLDVWYTLLDMLGFKEIARLMQVCKDLNNVLDSPSVWKYLARLLASRANACSHSLSFSTGNDVNSSVHNPKALATRMLRLERDAFQRVPATGIDVSTLDHSASPPDEQPKLIRCIEHPTRRAFILAPPARASDDANTSHQYASPQLLHGGRWVLALCITKHRVKRDSGRGYESFWERTKVAVVVWDLQALDSVREGPEPPPTNTTSNTKYALPMRVTRLPPAAQCDLYRSYASRRKMITQWDPRDKALNIVVAYTRSRGTLSANWDLDEESKQDIEDFIEVIQLTWSPFGEPSFVLRAVHNRLVQASHSERAKLKVEGDYIFRQWGTQRTLIWNWRTDSDGRLGAATGSMGSLLTWQDFFPPYLIAPVPPRISMGSAVLDLTLLTPRSIQSSTSEPLPSLRPTRHRWIINGDQEVEFGFIKPIGDEWLPSYFQNGRSMFEIPTRDNTRLELSYFDVGQTMSTKEPPSPPRSPPSSPKYNASGSPLMSPVPSPTFPPNYLPRPRVKHVGLGLAHHEHRTTAPAPSVSMPASSSTTAIQTAPQGGPTERIEKLIEFPRNAGLGKGPLWRTPVSRRIVKVDREGSGEHMGAMDNFRSSMVVSGWDVAAGVDVTTPSKQGLELVQRLKDQYPYSLEGQFVDTPESLARMASLTRAPRGDGDGDEALPEESKSTPQMANFSLLLPRSSFNTTLIRSELPSLLHHGFCPVTASLLAGMTPRDGPPAEEWPDDANWEDADGQGRQYEHETGKHPEYGMDSWNYEWDPERVVFSVFLPGDEWLGGVA